MPFVSKAQSAWAHTPAGMKALGGEAAVKEWEKDTNYAKIPKRKKTVKGGNTDLSPNSLKGQALTTDRKDNLAVKNQFKTRKSGTKVKI